jgi:DDE superfamily endonuclease
LATKHLRFHFQAVQNSGSATRNYKNGFSLILLGICDARYRFIVVDIGAYGRESDSGVFKRSVIGKKIHDKKLNVPPPSPVRPNGPILPYFLVGDEAFPLTTYLMRPYPGRSTGLLEYRKQIFNYRLSRARRVIENTFGILAARWRIYRREIIAKEETIRRIIQATVCLHNFIMTTDGGTTRQPGGRYFSQQLIDRENGEGHIIPGNFRLYNSTGKYKNNFENAHGNFFFQS